MSDRSSFRCLRRQQGHEMTFYKETRLHRQIYDHIRQGISVYKDLQYYNY